MQHVMQEFHVITLIAIEDEILPDPSSSIYVYEFHWHLPLIQV